MHYLKKTTINIKCIPYQYFSIHKNLGSFKKSKSILFEQMFYFLSDNFPKLSCICTHHHFNDWATCTIIYLPSPHSFFNSDFFLSEDKFYLCLALKYCEEISYFCCYVSFLYVGILMAYIKF